MSIGVYCDGHRMPENEERIVRQLFSLKHDDPIPDRFARLYWKQRYGQSLLGDHVVRSETLVTLAMMAGAQFAAPAPDTIYDLWRDRKAKRGTHVEYVWRDEPTIGTLVAVDATRGKCIVAGADNVQVEVDGATVKIATADKLQPA